jgi:multimeric flavodoxin WrbA
VAKNNQKQKVVIALGSPRKNGNSAALAEQIALGAESAGAKVETLFLHSMNISPCQSCWHCWKPDAKGCAIDDDMQTIYPKLLEANAWVIASPVYWFNVSAQTKLFIDRLLALPAYDSNAFAGRGIGIAMCYGDVDVYKSGCINALRSLEDSIKYIKAELIGMVYGSAHEPGEIRKNTALMAEAVELGKKLVTK